MANIIACYKWVLDEADIRFNDDLSIDTKGVKGKISDYDRNAIQMAVELASLTGARPVGITCGDEKCKQSFKDALSRGLEEAFWVNVSDFAPLDGNDTAAALAAGADKIGDYSYIICSEGSSDVYGRQTGARIAAALELPYIGSACQVTLDGDKLIVKRRLENDFETVSVKGPAVIAVLPEAILPVLPGLRALVAAGRKPVTEFDAKTIGFAPKNLTTPLSKKAYTMKRMNIILQNEDADEALKELITALRKDGVL